MKSVGKFFKKDPEHHMSIEGGMGGPPGDTDIQ